MIISSDADFWNGHADAGDGVIVLREQPATAIYWNGNGTLAIRQERAWDEDADTLILIQPENVATFARAILKAIGGTIADEAFTPSPSRDKTAAQRQRRYRERHRNGGNGNGVSGEAGNGDDQGEGLFQGRAPSKLLEPPV